MIKEKEEVTKITAPTNIKDVVRIALEIGIQIIGERHIYQGIAALGQSKALI